MASSNAADSLLFRVLRAAHARGTHHKLALDALPRLSGPHADQWRRLFLLHAEALMTGSKAPDDEFKDFQNHVLHVRDGYWGGAPEKARNWYELLVRTLRERNWSAAVYAAGVLSHYVTDPIHPFHTGQTAAENNVHRAVEWSINRSYDAIIAETRGNAGLPLPQPVASPAWLAELVTEGAELANRDYERLIAHYDFTRGVVEPTEGLDDVGRALVGDLLRLASSLYATVLDRALAEAGVEPPQVNLALASVLAVLAIPMKTLLKRLDDAADRRAVEANYDELLATGRVEATLSADDRTVRDMFEADVAAHRTRQQTKARTLRLPTAELATRAERMLVVPGKTVIALDPGPPKVPATASAPAAVELAAAPRVSAAPAASADQAPSRASSVPDMPLKPAEPQSTPPLDTVESRASSASGDISALAHGTAAVAVARGTMPSPADDLQTARTARAERGERKLYLTPQSEVVDAPSIGPKMAEMLSRQGILTVGDLFAADPERLAEALAIRGLIGKAIVDWQDQARLVCSIPGLRGTHAQMLVGAGYRSMSAIADASPSTLCADVLRFAGTTEGQRVLRNGEPPDVEKVKGWLGLAIEARAA